MPVSYNVGPGQLMYCPERDVAYNYPRMVSCIIRAFNKETWPQLMQVLTASGEGMFEDVLWEEICKAKEAYCQFLNTCCQDPSEKVDDVLKRCGFLDIRPEAQVAWMAMLGQVVTGQMFAGIRDITPQGEQHDVIIKLLAAGRDCARVMNGVPAAADQAVLSTGFTQYATALRESGMTQQQVRDLLASIFNNEQSLT